MLVFLKFDELGKDRNMVKWRRFRQTSLLLLRHDVFFLLWQVSFWRVKFSWVSTPKRKKSNHHLFSQVLGPGIVFSPLKHQRDRIGRNSCLVSGLLYMQPLQFLQEENPAASIFGVCSKKYPDLQTNLIQKNVHITALANSITDFWVVEL